MAAAAPWRSCMFPHHALWRQEKVRDGRGEVEHALSACTGHLLAYSTKHPEVLIDRHKRDAEHESAPLDVEVALKDRKEGRCLRRVDGDGAIIGRDLEEVEEGVRRVRVVAREREERVLAVHEDDRVVVLEEIFGRGGTSGAWKNASWSAMSLEQDEVRNASGRRPHRYIFQAVWPCFNKDLSK